MERQVSGLKAHMKNQELYGEEYLAEDFLDSVREQGILVPLAVKRDGTIISGHRRWQAARLLGMETVPVTFVEYESELEERRAIIDFNRQRQKTSTQRQKEADELEAIEAELAEIVRLANLKKGNKPPEVVILPHRKPGKTRDKVAAAIGMKPRTYEKERVVWKKAKDGDPVAQKAMERLDRGEITPHRAYLDVVKEEKKQRLSHPPLPEGKFRVIYADPPWQYDNSGFEQSAASHYPTMSTADICNLPIRDLAGEDAVLFLWVTNPFLEDGLKVCRAWGFEYKTNMVWVKNRGPGIGWFTQGRHELLFIATKGNGMHPKRKPLSVIESEVLGHSRKPPEVYGLIEEMYDGPCIELFARQSRHGWEAWGNEL